MDNIYTSALKAVAKSYKRPVLKSYLVLIGLRALADGDQSRVQLITSLLRKAVCHG